MSAIVIQDVEKRFRVYAERGQSLKETVLFKRRRYEEYPILRGISLSIARGEAVALIGRNGCGKSTLLKLISRILYPDGGTVHTHGRVSSLLELGAGFHPEMTGRENIYTNASIFGLTRKEIQAKLDEIIAFSELGTAIDRPVRTYSSGMYMRLAFAVAIHVGADILLIDEILAVGDAAFQAKCIARLMQLKAEGVTIVIVSHSMAQLERICDRSIWLENGRVRMDGIPAEVHPHYLEEMGQRLKVPPPEPERIPFVRLTQVALLNENGAEITQCNTGDGVTVRLQYQADIANAQSATLTLAVYRADALLCWSSNTGKEQLAAISLKSEGMLECRFTALSLNAGSYWLDAALRHPETGALYDARHRAVRFFVKNNREQGGVADLPHQWNI